MTDQWGFDSDNAQFEQANQNGNKGLRSWAEKKDQENKDLKAQLDALQAQLKQQQAVNTFEDLGLPRAAANLYSGELTPDAINSWANQVRAAFNVEHNPTEQTPPAPPALDAQTQQNLQQFTQAGAQGSTGSSIDDALRAQHQATSVQDLINNAALWQR